MTNTDCLSRGLFANIFLSDTVQERYKKQIDHVQCNAMHLGVIDLQQSEHEKADNKLPQFTTK